MSEILIQGCGAVSPAGWGLAPLVQALETDGSIPLKEVKRPGWANSLLVRQVPAPSPRPAFMAHPRLRRTSAITQYAVSAALEALGEDAARAQDGSNRLGIILCVMTGCVNYSRRFYDEVLRDPSIASPLLFPETVFNAPSSHLAALLGSPAINYTLVGDPGTFLQGLALAADWLTDQQADGCLVVGAEEIDWLTADAFRLFSPQIALSEGAGALYLRRGDAGPSPVALGAITSPHLFSDRNSRFQAAEKMRAELPESAPSGLLCDGTQNIPRLDGPEATAWKDWTGTRLSPKKTLGEGLMAAAAWQCVAAVDRLRNGRFPSAQVSIVGCSQQAIGGQFLRSVTAP